MVELNLAASLLFQAFCQHQQLLAIFELECCYQGMHSLEGLSHVYHEVFKRTEVPVQGVDGTQVQKGLCFLSLALGLMKFPSV